MGQHIAQLGPHKLALGKLAVVLELDKLAAVKLVVLDKLVVEPIAALVLDTVAAALELNKQLVAGLVVDRQLVARRVGCGLSWWPLCLRVVRQHAGALHVS